MSPFAFHAKIARSDRGRHQHFCHAAALSQRLWPFSDQNGPGRPFAPTLRMSAPMRTVYVLKNGNTPPRYYTGVTADLPARLEAHNAGRCSHTAKHRPWKVDVVVRFTDETRAVKFENYLKSGSGVEFARRHLR